MVYGVYIFNNLILFTGKLWRALNLVNQSPEQIGKFKFCSMTNPRKRGWVYVHDRYTLDSQNKIWRILILVFFHEITNFPD